MRGRVLQVLGVIGALVGSFYFYVVAGGMYGYAEFAQVWQSRLEQEAEPKIGVLIVVASLVVIGVGTLDRRKPAAKDPGLA